MNLADLPVRVTGRLRKIQDAPRAKIEQALTTPIQKAKERLGGVDRVGMLGKPADVDDRDGKPGTDFEVWVKNVAGEPRVIRVGADGKRDVRLDLERDVPAAKRADVQAKVDDVEAKARALRAANAQVAAAAKPVNGKPGKVPTPLMQRQQDAAAALAGALAALARELENANATCFYGNACFTVGTPIQVPGGTKPIEGLRSFEDVGDDRDWVPSRSEHDPDGPVTTRRVLRRFVRTGRLLDVHALDRVISTTHEHPFFVAGKGWVPAGELAIGDRLVLRDGLPVEVRAVVDTGRTETVHNVEVEDDHTYFVGADEWGFAVWVHHRYIFRGDIHHVLGQGERI